MYDFSLKHRSLLILITFLFQLTSSNGQEYFPLDAVALRMQLGRGVFSSSYRLVIHEGGSDSITDADALKLGEGFVSLAGLTDDGSRLAIDERHRSDVAKQVKLEVKGWETGDYTLDFKFNENFFRAYNLILIDEYLKSSKTITMKDTTYTFLIDMSLPATFGSSRFKLLLEPRSTLPSGISENIDGILVYPNPFKSSLYITVLQSHKPLSIKIRDSMGRSILDADIAKPNNMCEMATGHLTAGLYVIELYDQTDGRRVKSLKMIKK